VFCKLFPERENIVLTQKTNYHRSPLPDIGDIGYLVLGFNRWNEPRYYNDTKQRWQCIAYPVCDNIRPYSVGIHTAFFQNLKTKQIARLSGFYFESDNRFLKVLTIEGEIL
jgi:hypothetical protein